MPIPERMNTTFASARPMEPDRMVEARKRLRQRLIVALDVSSFEAAEEMVRQLEGVCEWFKVGLGTVCCGRPRRG